MSTIDFNHLSNLIPASLSPESAEELARALSTGRWWAIMEVLHPIDEERQFDFTSGHQSQTVETDLKLCPFLQQDDREFSASGPAETADASSVPEASDELATALAAGAIMEVERPIEEPQVDISSVPFLEAPETSPGASVPENGEPTTSPVLKSQIEPPGAPVYAESDTPGYLFFGNQNPTPAEPTLAPPVSSVSHCCLSLSLISRILIKGSFKLGHSVNGDVFQMVSAEPKDYKRFRRVSRCRRSPTMLKIREAWLKEFAKHMPLQNQQHVEVVASRGQNRIPEPQPEEQQQNEPERPQQRDLVINGRVRGVLRGLQSARPLRRMREQVSQSLLSL
nr:uncharacterized protein LOC564671 [Danio rerio]|eukprot:XP_021332014.1 uncharacterized protein LOC564671 [Danio rerio]